MKPASSFTAITSEGGLLPADFLAELLAPKAAIEGLTPVSYNLAEGERINEQVNRSWNRLKGRWTDLKKAIADKQPGEATTTETRDRWLYPIFQELGFGQKLPAARGIEIDGRSYPVSHGWSHVPIHLVGSHVDIDRRTPGAVGAAKASPHSLVQQVLNASQAYLWGIVSNGLTFRLLRDNIALTRISYVEWDLAAIFDGDLYSEFFVLWLVAHQSRFDAERPEQCWLEKWKKSAEDKGLRALENLYPGVKTAIAALGAGLVSHAANNTLREKLRAGQLSTQEFYRQVLRITYRLLCLFVAEDRALLHPPDESEAALKARRRYRDFYSVSRLRELTIYRAGTPHPDLWQVFQFITRKLGTDTGCPELALPALASFLWIPERSTPDLLDCQLSNRHFLEAVHALAFVRDGSVRRTVDYRNLGSEEFGSVYEGLLELHPRINANVGLFELEVAGGNERKTSGSYYTPDSLVQCLLDSALEPVIAERLGKAKTAAEKEAALLSLRVCDPSVGSGHFLIRAGHRIARHLAIVRSGEEEPSPAVYRTALREVISHCLYGVDVNPMAVELCKVTLWLEATEPGKPLSFLDHHIQCGNSLLGATPRALADGLPDDAFKSIEGDDKTVCAEAKKRNKDESRQLALFHGTETTPSENLGNLPVAMLEVNAMGDDTAAALHRKEQRYTELVRSASYENARFLADAWCAAFVWKKTRELPYPITNGVLHKIERNPRDCAPWMREEIERLRDRYQFFHWHLVFPVPEKSDRPGNGHAGWNGGFDVILGNPPWEHTELKEKEWFAERGTEIANASTGAKRKAMIAQLAEGNPALWVEYLNALRLHDGASHFLGGSGQFPFCGRGRINHFAVFAELMRGRLNEFGQMGGILPTGIATDDTTKLFFQDIVVKKALVSLYDFANTEELFKGVDRNAKFCLLTLTQGTGRQIEAASVAFGATKTEDIASPEKRFELRAEDIALLNPNTLTCPVFRTVQDAILNRAIYQRIPILLLDSAAGGNPWGVSFSQGLFNTTTDSKLFVSIENLKETSRPIQGNRFERDGEAFYPLYEGKMIQAFDHRYANSLAPDTGARIRGKSEHVESSAKRDPGLVVFSRHYVREVDCVDRVPATWRHKWFLGWRAVGGAVANVRTLVCSVVPFGGVANKVLLMYPTADARLATLLLCSMNSFVVDYCIRQKISGLTLNYFIIKQLPVLPPATYAEPCVWAGQPPVTLRDWLLPRVLELTYTAWDLEPFARDCGWFGPPFVWDEARRFQLRCELDAAFLHLYGLSRADAAYILDTFPIVRRKDEAAHGTYRTKDTILAIYDQLAEAKDTETAFTSPLDPPTGDIRVCHPPRT
jgi:hypothetical protein